MKQISDYILEKLKINKDIKIDKYHYFPKDKKELEKIVKQLIKERGNEANLNDIDTSHITDMSELFDNSNFNGDISEWDVSNVKNMYSMFYNSKFNGDISEWDVSNVENMNQMFNFSDFNVDISKWDVSNVKNMYYIFKKSPLEKNPPSWYHE